MNSFLEWVGQTGNEISKSKITCLQLNLGYKCNLKCDHCHIDAGPQRNEIMNWDVITDVLKFIDKAKVTEVDITGGSPEMNPNLKGLIDSLRKRDFINRILLRTNLAIFQEEAYRDLPKYFAANNIELVASMPCYLEENVDQQRGKGVYQKNIEILKSLNKMGFGIEGTEKKLHLVYNPLEAQLPGSQDDLKLAYKDYLFTNYGVEFNQLFTITNMPLGRFYKKLIRQDGLKEYLEMLKQNSNSETLSSLMCRYTVNVDWQGYVYDCDFNQVLGQPLTVDNAYIGNLDPAELDNLKVVTGDHCFGCTAGTGSSCRGSLTPISA